MFYRKKGMMMNLSDRIGMEENELDESQDREDVAFLSSTNDNWSSEESSDSDYFRLFNARNAKIIALLVLAILMLYHSVLHLQRIREDSCIGLLKGGRYQGDHIWQPYGCMLHMYSRASSRACMKSKRQDDLSKNWIVFVGDRRMRQMYADFVDQFNTETFKINPNVPQDSHFKDKDSKLQVDFYWNPHVDAEMKNILSLLSTETSKGFPSILVLGVALTTINETGYSHQILKDYSSNISLLLPYIQQMSQNTTILWVLQGNVDQYKITSLNNGTSTNLTNNVIGRFNDEAETVLFYSPVKVWKSAALLSSGYNKDSIDGVSIGPVALEYDTQVLVNMYCNAIMNFPDGSCCGSSEPLTRAQLISFVVYFLCIALAGIFGLLRCDVPALSNVVENGFLSVDSVNTEQRRQGTTASRSQFKVFPVMTSLAKLSLFMFFFYICDRADFFMKENKWFTYVNLFLPVAYLTVLGLFFTEDTTETEFMHREQTEEWKGWMQLVILCYNLTGASQLWTYMAFRCLFSSYLFLSGYGHFMYFWTTGDFSPGRLVRVLIRYNLLTALLCVTMSRPYQFYSYVPLVSYWFVICYLTLALPPQVTASSCQNNPVQYFFVVLKFVVLFSLVSVFYMSEIFFEKVHVFGPWRSLFVNSDESILDWWGKWSQDRYTPSCGMALAFIVVLMRRYYLLNDGQSCNLFSKRLTVLSTLGAMCGLTLYGTVAFNCRTKADCIEVHGYIVIVPVLSYLLLRNLFGFIRTRISTFFAWFGRVTLEVFTTQSHIWLAADGNGVLVLLPRWPVLNVLVTWFLFVSIAHECRLVTMQLLPVLVPENEPKILLRNVFTLLVCASLGALLLQYL